MLEKQDTKKIISAAMAMTVIIIAFMLTILSMGGMESEILYCIPGAVIFFVLFAIRGRNRGRTHLIVFAGAVVLLVTCLVLLRSDIANGLKMVANQIYISGEDAQKYIYIKYDIGIYGYDLQMATHIAVIWAACAVGVLVAVPPFEMRKVVCLDIGLLSMLCAAYFGLIPNVIGMVLMLISVIYILGGERIGASWPLLVSGLLVLALVLVVNPGESKSISKVDEQIRDAVSTNNVILSGLKNREKLKANGDNSESKSSSQNNRKKNDDNSSGVKLPGKMLNVLLLILLFSLILFVPAVINDRIKKKQAVNRRGLDSEDDRMAVIAMFPYAMKWLTQYGIEVENRPFTSLVDKVRMSTDEEYFTSFGDMLKVWEKAAFSDHSMTADCRTKMNDFLNRTMAMTKKKVGLKGMMRIKFRLAL